MDSELHVLQSIYPELVLHPSSQNEHHSTGGYIDIPVVLDTPAKILFDTAPALDHITYLPPLRCHILVPDTYPVQSPPILRLDCVWLSSDALDALRDACLALWEPEMEVLFAMVDQLMQSACMAFDMLDLVQATIGPLQGILFPILKAHQEEAAQAVFDAQTYSCEICLDVKPGDACVALPCRHVFCRACLGDMFGLHIREGAVSLVRCPTCPLPKETPEASLRLDPDTLSARRMPVATLQKVVSADQVARYNHLSRKQELEALPSHTHCPRDWCATALPRDPDEKLVVCTACGYAFCADCSRTWHGISEPCRRLKLSYDLAEQYLALGDDLSGKGKLERLYGRKNLERLVRDMEDERLADTWRHENAQQCPNCESWVQKASGCNHMSCSVCRCHFCFLCGESLPVKNPYLHYGKGMVCAGRLFEGLTGLEDAFAEGPFA